MQNSIEEYELLVQFTDWFRELRDQDPDLVDFETSEEIVCKFLDENE